MFEFLKKMFETKEKLIVTADTKMGDLLDYDPGVADVLMMNGMHCVTCPSARGEALKIACQVHGMDVDSVVVQINEYLENKHN